MVFNIFPRPQMYLDSNSEFKHIQNSEVIRIMGQKYAKTSDIFSPQNLNLKRGTNVINIEENLGPKHKNGQFTIFGDLTVSKWLLQSNIYLYVIKKLHLCECNRE